MITGRQRLSSRIYVESNGEVTLSDGRRVKLREGEMVTLAGELREAPAFLR